MSIAKKIELLTHSSIRIKGKNTIYIDPYKIEEETHDADIILVTHEHHDHFSPEDIAKIQKKGTRLVVPDKMKEKASQIVLEEGKLITIRAGEIRELKNIMVEAIPAYNIQKSYHPKKNGGLGYIVYVDGLKIYVAGDTDITKENQKVSCDIAMVPIGGTYTMDAVKAAELVNIIRPQVAIPTHYGSVAGTQEDEKVFQERVDKNIKVEIKMQKY